VLAAASKPLMLPAAAAAAAAANDVVVCFVSSRYRLSLSNGDWRLGV